VSPGPETKGSFKMFKFTIAASSWADLVTVGALASTDNDRPLLTGVLIEVTRDGVSVNVRTVATDSYALGIIERGAEAWHESTTMGIESGETVKALISFKGLNAATKSAVKDAGRGGMVRVTIDGERATVAACYGWSLEYPAEIIAGTYPDYRSLITPDSTYSSSPGVNAIALNLHYLARFAKVAPWNGDKVSGTKFMINDVSRPIKAVAGGTTVLLMPVRMQ